VRGFSGGLEFRVARSLTRLRSVTYQAALNPHTKVASPEPLQHGDYQSAHADPQTPLGATVRS
jgi:hypothetical protein